MKTTLGGDRLGSGNKQDIHLRNYERSTHDLGYVWRSTMASGTLVPFINEIGLPGDTFDINLNAHVLTHPTIGPLFGSYKLQLDVFQIPMRLYIRELHMNMLGVGMRMKDVKIPQMEIKARRTAANNPIEVPQVNPSSLQAYLGVRGIGNNRVPTELEGMRYVNAIPTLAYWDIYKNYYANKQEGIGMVIHNDMVEIEAEIDAVEWFGSDGLGLSIGPIPMPTNAIVPVGNENNYLRIAFIGLTEEFDIDRLEFEFTRFDGNYKLYASQIYQNWQFDIGSGELIGTGLIRNFPNDLAVVNCNGYSFNTETVGILPPKISEFSLENIDTVRLNIMEQPIGTPYIIDESSIAPFGLPLKTTGIGENKKYSITSSMEGLGLKTYQSDLFNNWLDKEWMDGSGTGVNDISKVSTTGDFFTIDQLNLSKKIYDMLNRIAVSGGSYDDWLDATYTHERAKTLENPIYMGGLSKEVVFQEVISNAASIDEPLGTLAGRGKLSDKHKGGKVRIKIDEPSVIIGIVSLTPRIDYSQGNKWSIDLKTIDDLHKPALDGIGFQNLMTDNMAYWRTTLEDGLIYANTAVGKVPAWINYMTNVNQVYGNFAMRTQQMYMVLNRNYEADYGSALENPNPRIKDLTTYIDPSKFNHIFADTRLDAQNFWVQLGIDMNVRRKMSAKIIPNL